MFEIDIKVMTKPVGFENFCGDTTEYNEYLEAFESEELTSRYDSTEDYPMIDETDFNEYAEKLEEYWADQFANATIETAIYFGSVIEVIIYLSDDEGEFDEIDFGTLLV